MLRFLSWWNFVRGNPFFCSSSVAMKSRISSTTCDRAPKQLRRWQIWFQVPTPKNLEKKERDLKRQANVGTKTVAVLTSEAGAMLSAGAMPSRAAFSKSFHCPICKTSVCICVFVLYSNRILQKKTSSSSSSSSKISIHLISHVPSFNYSGSK